MALDRGEHLHFNIEELCYLYEIFEPAPLRNSQKFWPSNNVPDMPAAAAVVPSYTTFSIGILKQCRHKLDFSFSSRLDFLETNDSYIHTSQINSIQVTENLLDS